MTPRPRTTPTTTRPQEPAMTALAARPQLVRRLQRVRDARAF